MNRLKNKVALITGASSGQGAQEALLFASEGAAVAICDIQDSAGEALALRIQSEGGEARYWHLDVTSESEWKTVASSVFEWKERLDVLVNNAGVIIRKGILDTEIEDWQRLLAINLTGAFLGIKICAPKMAKSRGSSIMNISSIAGHTGYYDAAYAASKWALRGLTKTAAMEFADKGIRVNAICPGLIVTPLNEGLPHVEVFRKMIPQGRVGRPQDVAQLALFLASDESGYITGEDILIDGGFTAGAAVRNIHQEGRAM